MKDAIEISISHIKVNLRNNKESLNKYMTLPYDERIKFSCKTQHYKYRIEYFEKMLNMYKDEMPEYFI